MVQIINPLTIVNTGGGGGLNSISITNKADYASAISLPTTGVPQDGTLTVVTDPVDSPYFVTSSNEAVARVVYSNGGYKLRLIGPGTAIITAYSGNKSDTVTVTTTQATTAITTTNLPAFCDKGSTYQMSVLTYTPSSSYLNGVTWSSSDTSVATVDQTGLVTFVDIGSFSITATVNGYPSIVSTKSASVIAKEADPDFDAIHTMIQAGTAEVSYPVGSELSVKYSENGGTTEYTMPWIVMGYRTNVDVEVNGTVTQMNVMDIMPKYVNMTNVRYSRNQNEMYTQITSASGETTAQDGYYYYSSSNVPLNYETGDTLDFSTYPTIRKSTYNVDTQTKANNLFSNGDRRWEYSNARTWLNTTYLSYYPASFTNHLGKVKVTTVYSAYEYPGYTAGTIADTYDYFYCPSKRELYGAVSGATYTQTQYDNEGVALPYWAQASGQSSPSDNQTNINNARRRAAINQQTSYQNYWLRSVYSASAYGEWCCCGSGYVSYDIAYDSRRLAPIAALI